MDSLPTNLPPATNSQQLPTDNLPPSMSPPKPTSSIRFSSRFVPLFLILIVIITFLSSLFYFSRQPTKKKGAIQSAPLTPTAPPPSPTPDLGTILITMYPLPTSSPEEKSQPVNSAPVAFTIVAENDTFTPNQITARQGQIITLNFTAKDKDYDIAIPQLGLRRTIKAGETKSLEFQAQSFGQFLFLCASGCNQTTARGLLTIKP